MGDNNGNIQKGLNVFLYYWTIVALIIFITINYTSRNLRLEALDIGLMISVVTFLFGFLISITFSILLTRVGALKESLSGETGRLVSLFSLSKHLGINFHTAMEDRIDNYTINTLRDYTNYSVGREAIYGIFDDLSLVELKTKAQSAIFDSFLYIFGELEPLREKLEYLTSRRLEWSLKLSNYILGAILIILLFLNRGDSFTNTLFVILSTVVVFVLLIVEDYDNLRIGAYTVSISDSEQLFDLIGRERYYPKGIVRMAKLDGGRTYRIGIFDPVLKSEKIFRLTYNPMFKLKISKLAEKLRRKKEIPLG